MIAGRFSASLPTQAYRLDPPDRPMSALEEIQALVHKKYGVDPATLDPNASMREAGIDSLTLVEILFAVEVHFGISVPEKYNAIDTMAELAAAVEELRAEKLAA
jgi:acyl carrier protein